MHSRLFAGGEGIAGQSDGSMRPAAVKGVRVRAGSFSAVGLRSLVRNSNTRRFTREVRNENND